MKTRDVDVLLDKLKKHLHSLGSCAVAYSGGVDSTLLVQVAHEVLGEDCLAVIARSSTYPDREYAAAVAWLQLDRIPYTVIVSEELDIPGFAANLPDRCYHCKKELFAKIRQEADARGLAAVLDGTNADDAGDYRPGMKAAREAGVGSPLLECGLTKADIRHISREVYRLPTAGKQSMACMSSRIPYGSAITREKLAQIEAVEDHLFQGGFQVFRARHHGDTLRLELGETDMARLARPEMRRELAAVGRKNGFAYVTMDLEGFRSGSMNDLLQLEKEERPDVPAGGRKAPLPERSSDEG